MSAFYEIIDYLKAKVSRTNINNPKSNTGCVLIKTHKGWEDKADKLIMITYQNVLSQFMRKHPEYGPGESAFTSTSMSVGKHSAPYISREPLEVKHQLALGDLLIECFAYHGYVKAERPSMGREGYILSSTPKWNDHFDKIPEKLAALTIIGSEEERPAMVESKSQHVCGREVSIHKVHEDLFQPNVAYSNALNNLQQTEWVINRRVLNVLSQNPISNRVIEDNEAKEQKRKSKSIERSFIIAKANELSKMNSFFQFFDVDYRGRLYNLEPFLNYQSSDSAKSLLMFKKQKELTESGAYWLAIHTAASYNQSYSKDELPDWCEEDYRTHLENEKLDDISVDKMTLNDRANWTINNFHLIEEWARNDTVQEKAEKPWVFLACCYEWLDIRETQCAGEVAYTSLPIPVDGSNNGWQHLGAISKDIETGELVGLTDVQIPKDFYVQTAKRTHQTNY